MRVLITNQRIDLRGGAELSTRQLARALQERGHSVMAFSSDPRQRARHLENDIVPVATDLVGLPVAPDIIHAQHHLDVMTALSALPDVPAVLQCPAGAWPDPPMHPRIYTYLAPSMAEAQRIRELTATSGADVQIWRRPLDLDSPDPLQPLPPRLQRALYFNRRCAGDEPLVSAIAETTTRLGIALEFASRWFDPAVDATQRLFAPYDLVFTSGLAAMEALACGRAVVLTGRGTCGALALPEHLPRMIRDEFRVDPNPAPPSPASVETEIKKYSATACRQATTLFRAGVDGSRAYSELVGIYGAAIASHRRRTSTAAADVQAVSRYLRHIAPAITGYNAELRGQWASASRDHTFYELRARLTRVEERTRPR